MTFIVFVVPVAPRRLNKRIRVKIYYKEHIANQMLKTEMMNHEKIRPSVAIWFATASSESRDSGLPHWFTADDFQSSTVLL